MAAFCLSKALPNAVATPLRLQRNTVDFDKLRRRKVPADGGDVLLHLFLLGGAGDDTENVRAVGEAARRQFEERMSALRGKLAERVDDAPVAGVKHTAG